MSKKIPVGVFRKFDLRPCFTLVAVLNGESLKRGIFKSGNLLKPE